MNALQRSLARLNGEPCDRPPNWDIVMAYAAHHVGQPLRAYYLDHRVLVQANLAMVQGFGLDLVQAISDPYREACDLGAPVTFPADGLPVAGEPLLSDPATLSRLRLVEPSQGRRMADRLEAVHALRQQAGDDLPVMGWVEGALAEAADLRGVGQLLVDLYDRPAWVEELLAFCCEQAIAFARAQIAAGAHLIGLGDAIASQVSPAAYRRFALPYEQRIFHAVHEQGALARLHICGDTTRLLSDMVATDADVIDLDWMVSLAAARQAFGQGPALCGNFDPVAVMLRGSPAEVRAWTMHCLAAGGPKSISGAGCELPDGTPAANLRAQREAIGEFAALSAAAQAAWATASPADGGIGL
jgi:uroporphyrinogen decarboxylase